MILHWLLIEPAFENCRQMLQLWLHRAFGPDTDISKINTNPWSLIQWSLTWWSSDLWYGFSRKLSFEQDNNPPLHHDPVDKCLFTKFPWNVNGKLALLSHQHVIFVTIPEEFPIPVMTPYNLCTWKDTSCMDCLCVNSSLHANSKHFTG